MKNILVTGGTGFIAQALFPKLLSANWKVRTTLRNEKKSWRLPDEIEKCVLGDLGRVTDWKSLMNGVDAVVHLAARVHHMNDKGQSTEKVYQKANVELTRTLAEESVKAGVQRFVFLSSVKAMGEETPAGESWDESFSCSPQDAYGRSKYDAENILMNTALKTDLEVVILRIPLVYGPGIKANMAHLFRIVDRGLPLPLGTVKNARSMLFVGNLIDAIRAVLDHPKAAGQTYLVSDGEDISTSELSRRIAKALDRPARLFPIPSAILKLTGKLTGKSEMVDRLLNSLVIDSSKIRLELNWTPPYSMAQGLQQTAEWFSSLRKN